jgi:hypothetical protein
MSSTYTTYMGTVSFTATTESWSETSDSNVEVLSFPGSNSIAISITGQRETRRTFKALFATVAAFRLCRDMRAKQGSLLVENWDITPVNAVLKRVAPDAPFSDGQVVAQVEFILY